MKFWYAELNDDANSPTDGHTFVAGSLDGLKQDIRAWVNGVDGDSFVDVSHVEMGSLTLRNLSAFLANRVDDVDGLNILSQSTFRLRNDRFRQLS